MIKRTITYTDFNGNSRTEDMYFNMTKSELVAFSFTLPDEMKSEIGNEENFNVEETGAKLAEKMGNSGIFNFVKDLVFKSYGIKSEDGRRFIKSDELSTEFTQTIAYDEFLMDLFSDDRKTTDFINGIIPADIADKMAARKLN